MKLRDLPWQHLPALVIVGALAVLAYKLDVARKGSELAARGAEAAKLEAKGIAVAAQAEATDLRAALGAAAAESADLASEIARLRAAAPDAKPIAVVHGTTGPIAAQATVVAAAQDHGTAAPACLLHAGEYGEIRIDSAEFRTNAGNVLLAGSASAWRLNPEARLFGGPLHLTGTVEEQSLPAGWGFGVTGFAGRSGWMAGPALGLPPFRFWSLQLEPSFAAVVGPQGDWGVGGTVLIRRWR